MKNFFFKYFVLYSLLLIINTKNEDEEDSMEEQEIIEKVEENVTKERPYLQSQQDIFVRTHSNIPITEESAKNSFNQFISTIKNEDEQKRIILLKNIVGDVLFVRNIEEIDFFVNSTYQKLLSLKKLYFNFYKTEKDNIENSFDINELELIMNNLKQFLNEVKIAIENLSIENENSKHLFIQYILTLFKSEINGFEKINNLNLLISGIIYKICEKINNINILNVLWHNIEFFLFHELSTNIKEIFSYTSLWLNDLLKNNKLVFPSFIYFYNLINNNLNILDGFTEYFINQSYSEVNKIYNQNILKIERKNTRNVSVINDFENSYKVSYLSANNGNKIVVFNENGLYKESMSDLVSNPSLYNKRENKLNENILLVVPYFNILSFSKNLKKFISNENNNKLISDMFVISSVLKNILLKNIKDINIVIPLFVPIVNDNLNSSNGKYLTGIGSIATYIHSKKDKPESSNTLIGVFYGVQDLLYQPVVYNEALGEFNSMGNKRFFHKIEHINNSYKTNGSYIYMDSINEFLDHVKNQPLFGETTAFWNIINNDFLFLSGINDDIAGKDSYKIVTKNININNIIKQKINLSIPVSKMLTYNNSFNKNGKIIYLSLRNDLNNVYFGKNQIAPINMNKDEFKQLLNKNIVIIDAQNNDFVFENF